MMTKIDTRCVICGRFIKPNSYNACLYPRYCYEKAAMKENESLTKAVDILFQPDRIFIKDED